MSRSVEIERLSAGALFKLIFLGTSFGLAPVGLLAGIFAFFGAPTVSVAGVIYTGLGGFFIGLLMGPFLGLVYGTFAAVVVRFGWWIYGHFSVRSLRAELKSDTLQ
jgi:hypothetical protein